MSKTKKEIIVENPKQQLKLYGFEKIDIGTSIVFMQDVKESEYLYVIVCSPNPILIGLKIKVQIHNRS